MNVKKQVSIETSLFALWQNKSAALDLLSSCTVMYTLSMPHPSLWSCSMLCPVSFVASSYIFSFHSFPVHFPFLFLSVKSFWDLLLINGFYKTVTLTHRQQRFLHNNFVQHSNEAHWAWRFVLFTSQPDLLNFKKGWMSKLDDSGEVKYSKATCSCLFNVFPLSFIANEKGCG